MKNLWPKKMKIREKWTSFEGYEWNNCLDQCKAAIEGITEEEILEAIIDASVERCEEKFIARSLKEFLHNKVNVTNGK